MQQQNVQTSGALCSALRLIVPRVAQMAEPVISKSSIVWSAPSAGNPKAALPQIKTMKIVRLGKVPQTDPEATSEPLPGGKFAVEVGPLLLTSVLEGSVLDGQLPSKAILDLHVHYGMVIGVDKDRHGWTNKIVDVRLNDTKIQVPEMEESPAWTEWMRQAWLRTIDSDELQHVLVDSASASMQHAIAEHLGRALPNSSSFMDPLAGMGSNTFAPSDNTPSFMRSFGGPLRRLDATPGANRTSSIQGEAAITTDMIKSGGKHQNLNSSKAKTPEAQMAFWARSATKPATDVSGSSQPFFEQQAPQQQGPKHALEPVPLDTWSKAFHSAVEQRLRTGSGRVGTVFMQDNTHQFLALCYHDGTKQEAVDIYMATPEIMDVTLSVNIKSGRCTVSDRDSASPPFSCPHDVALSQDVAVRVSVPGLRASETGGKPQYDQFQQDDSAGMQMVGDTLCEHCDIVFESKREHDRAKEERRRLCANPPTAAQAFFQNIGNWFRPKDQQVPTQVIPINPDDEDEYTMLDMPNIASMPIMNEVGENAGNYLIKVLGPMLDVGPANMDDNDSDNGDMDPYNQEFQEEAAVLDESTLIE